MTTRIIIVNEGPDNVEVAVTGDPTYTIGKGQHQGQYVYEGKEINIKEVKILTQTDAPPVDNAHVAEGCVKFGCKVEG
jgi:hypothetical protein